MLDIFKQDAFSTLSLTTSINMLPHKPGRLGSLGLFKTRGITHTSAVFEEQNGRLSLIQSQARGTMPATDSRPKRKVRSLAVPHLPLNDTVMADEVQSVRAFGEEDVVETVASVVNGKLQALKDNHEVTLEYHRAGAIQGIILDADGSEMYNLFDFFQIDENEIEIDFTDPDLDMKLICTRVQRMLEDALGADTYTSIRAFCGNDFWDAFVATPTVADSFQKWQVGTNGMPFSMTTQRSGFTYCEIVWENYRGKVGSVPFIPSDTCRFVVEGAGRLFETIYAPANFVETVNTVGKPIYAKQEPMKFDVGVEIHSQSNPLNVCTRPRTLIKGTGIFTSSSSS